MYLLGTLGEMSCEVRQLYGPFGYRLSVRWSDKPNDLKVKKMALEEISRLYDELVDTEFHVMPAGQFHIEDIYTKVKSNFSSLCDDSYLCIDNCGRGHNHPEWKHAVRRALDRLKRISPRVPKGERNYWTFK
jgi:hypothetical protein